MPKLPVISGKEFAKVLVKIGFEIRNQTGSHIILKRERDGLRVSVPNHAELDRGTLLGLMRDVKLSRSDLEMLLR